MDTLLRTVEGLVLKADFNQADSLLQETARKRLTSDQEGTIRRYRTRLRKTSFLHHNPVELRIASDRKVYLFGESVPLRYEVFNLSDHGLLIPGRGAFSWLPWSEKRKSCILSDIELTDVSLREGVLSSGRWSEVFEFDGSWEIAPGTHRRMDRSIDLALPAELVYRRMKISAELIPGGLQTGPFDWGMIRLPFASRVVHIFQEEDLDIRSNPLEAFERALEDRDGRRILLASVLLDEGSRWMAVEGIIGVLPELPSAAKRAALAALEWLTGERLGYDLFKWQDWWDIRRRDLGGEIQGRPGDRHAPDRRIGALLPSSMAGLTLLPSVLIGAVSTGDCGAGPPERDGVEADLKEDAYQALLDGLTDPFYARRYKAKKTLQNMGDLCLPWMKRLLDHESPRVRRAAAEVLGQFNGEEASRLLIRALKSEADPSVLERIAQSLGFSESLPGAEVLFPDFLPEIDRYRRIYIDTAVMITLEKILHFGSIPGFYDGQFSNLRNISQHVYGHLVSMAKDPDCSFQIRVLAIMALQECRDEALLDALEGLIIPPSMELHLEWLEYTTFPLTEELILQNQARNLSKYARFSLAKAGITEFNLDKIAVMKRWLQERGRLYLQDRPDRNIQMGGNVFDSRKEFAKNLLLDIAYNYQQFDAFDQAERWYMMLIDRYSMDRGTAIIAEAHYNLACLYALTNRKALAIKHLRQSIEMGFLDFSWMDRDRDLESLRNEPEFKALRDMIINRPVDEEIPDVDKETRDNDG